MSQKGVCWRQGFSAVPAVFLVISLGLCATVLSLMGVIRQEIFGHCHADRLAIMPLQEPGSGGCYCYRYTVENIQTCAKWVGG